MNLEVSVLAVPYVSTKQSMIALYSSPKKWPLHRPRAFLNFSFGKLLLLIEHFTSVTYYKIPQSAKTFFCFSIDEAGFGVPVTCVCVQYFRVQRFINCICCLSQMISSSLHVYTVLENP